MNAQHKPLPEPAKPVSKPISTPPQRSLDAYAIKPAAAVPPMGRAIAVARPLDDRWEAMAKVAAEAPAKISEWFVPTWFLVEKRDERANTEYTSVKQADSVRRWFMSWQKLSPARENLKLATIYRKGNEKGSPFTESGVSVYLTVLAPDVPVLEPAKQQAA